MYSAEVTAKLSGYRERAKGNGAPLTMDEMREIIIILRAERVAGTAAPTKKSPSKQAVDTQSLLGELDSL